MKCLRCHYAATVRCRSRCGYVLCAKCSSLEWHRCKLAGIYDYESPQVDISRNKELFDQFYEENKGEKLYPSTPNNINLQQLNAWVEAVENSGSPEEIVNFARIFAQNLTYIGFERFHARLNQVAQEVRTRIMALAPERVYALIGMNFRKSTTWVALLVWEVIRPVVTDVVIRLSDIPFDDANSNIAIIHMDDMSYSGEQIGTLVDRVVGALQPENHYFLLVPYIGMGAKQHLTRIWKHLIFPRHAFEVPSLGALLRWEGQNVQEIVKMLRNEFWQTLYGAQPHQSLIYFNHKLADNVSVPNKMMATLYVADAKQKIIGAYHAIQGCENVTYKTPNGKVLGPDVAVGDFDEKHTCPVAFYKTIKYTFNGITLSNSEQPLLEIIDKM